MMFQYIIMYQINLNINHGYGLTIIILNQNLWVPQGIVN
jgi:hypothetical protein